VLKRQEPDVNSTPRPTINISR